MILALVLAFLVGFSAGRRSVPAARRAGRAGVLFALSVLMAGVSLIQHRGKKPERASGTYDGPLGMKRMALYVRVSTEEQAKHGVSVDHQLGRAREFCKAKEYHPVGPFIDPGHTGRDMDRPGYQELWARREEWDGILVLKLDRSHRNRRNFEAMMEALEQEGKSFESITESWDTSTAMGKFVLGILVLIAQLESDQTSERVESTMQDAAKRGIYLGGGEPYGYRRVVVPREVAEATGERTRLEIDPFEAGVIRKMHEFREAFIKEHGTDYGAGAYIADKLNELGVTSKTQGAWSRQIVNRILKNPLLYGKLVQAGAVAEVPHLRILPGDPPSAGGGERAS